MPSNIGRPARERKRVHLAPYQRVVTLSLSLLLLMTLIVGLGTLGVHHMRSDFDDLVAEDLPRFDALLHLDRDLFRAQLALENAMLASNANQRFESLAEYQNQVDRTENRWLAYLDVSAGGSQELQWQSDYDAARARWLASSAALAALIEADGGSDLHLTTELALAQADFVTMRDVVDHLEEDIAEPLIDASTASVTDQADTTTSDLTTLLAIGLMLGAGISFTTYRAARQQHRQSGRSEAEQAADTARALFEAELGQALDMAQDEMGATHAVELVLAAELPGRPAELLLADSSHAHLTQALTTDKEHGGPGCGVFEPGDCPAVRRGTTLTFDDSEAYSACPYLRGRDIGPTSAVCVPVSVAGRSAGVLHSTGEVNAVASGVVVHKLEEVADRAGDRIGVIRAFAQSQTLASTDALTGLANRRSFENEANSRLRSGSKLAFVYGDLDHFKLLNDKHGHDAGDRALRLFSRVLSESIRETDMAARWGGEEFVLMFANADTEIAVRLIERIRENMILAQAASTTPPFTASFGVSDTSMAEHLDELVNLADESLLEAKKRGRNCTVVSQGHLGEADPEPVEA